VQRATWGGLISEASQNLGTQPWLLVPSGVLVITFILALGLVGDAVRDAVAERYDDAPPDRGGAGQLLLRRRPRRPRRAGARCCRFAD